VLLVDGNRPSTFSFVKNEAISVQQVMLAEDLDSLLYLPISIEAFDELHQLQTMLTDIQYHPNDYDSWVLVWGNQNYSSRRYYHIVFENLQVHQIFKALWKSKCIPHIKLFFVVLLVDRLNTRTMPLRRNYHVQPNEFCVLCPNNTPEDIDHLLFTYPFALACW
jgi:hypothetical protein